MVLSEDFILIKTLLLWLLFSSLLHYCQQYKDNHFRVKNNPTVMDTDKRNNNLLN